MGNIIGYARVSTEDQNLSSQVDELTKAGCEKIFEDIVSGAKAERKGLEDCLSTLQAGDTLMVWRIDRLGRSLKHLVDIVTDLKDRGIKFKSLRDGAIDTTTASGELIFNIFCCLAQFEKRLIQERTNAGLSAARARGRLGGRKPITADDERVVAVKKLSTDKSMSIMAICRTVGISRASYYRFVNM